MLEVADELAIRELNARYIDAVNRGDALAWRATWAENARWRIFGTELSGGDAILEFWKGAMSQFDFVVMVLNSGTLEPRGAGAGGRWYVTEFLRSRDGSGRMVLGSYRDEYARESGAWKFALRSYHVIYQGAFDLSGAHQPVPA